MKESLSDCSTICHLSDTPPLKHKDELPFRLTDKHGGTLCAGRPWAAPSSGVRCTRMLPSAPGTSDGTPRSQGPELALSPSPPASRPDRGLLSTTVCQARAHSACRTGRQNKGAVTCAGVRRGSGTCTTRGLWPGLGEMTPPGWSLAVQQQPPAELTSLKGMFCVPLTPQGTLLDSCQPAICGVRSGDTSPPTVSLAVAQTTCSPSWTYIGAEVGRFPWELLPAGS